MKNLNRHAMIRLLVLAALTPVLSACATWPPRHLNAQISPYGLQTTATRQRAYRSGAILTSGHYEKRVDLTVNYGRGTALVRKCEVRWVPMNIETFDTTSSLGKAIGTEFADPIAAAIALPIMVPLLPFMAVAGADVQWSKMDVILLGALPGFSYIPEPWVADSTGKLETLRQKLAGEYWAAHPRERRTQGEWKQIKSMEGKHYKLNSLLTSKAQQSFHPLY